MRLSDARGLRDPVPVPRFRGLRGSPVTTGVGAVVNTAQVKPGDNVVVFGLGGIGLNVIQGAKMAGADRIVGVDINPSKKEWGEKFGMTDFVNPKEVSDVVAHLVHEGVALSVLHTRPQADPVAIRTTSRHRWRASC